MPKKEAHPMSMPDMREEAVGKAALILRGARRAFLAGGFGAVSMDAIAREAGVSKETVYAHFGRMEDLFGAVVAYVAELRFAGFLVRGIATSELAALIRKISHVYLVLDIVNGS